MREDWVYGDWLTLQLAPSDTGGEAGSAAAVAREYAVLLTRAVALADECSVRVAGLPAQIGMLWVAHLAARRPLQDSPHVEDIIEIVMQRRAIIDEVLAAPEELRQIVSHAAREFLSDESSSWALRRALPDARLAPGVIARASARFQDLADVYPA